MVGAFIFSTVVQVGENWVGRWHVGTFCGEESFATRQEALDYVRRAIDLRIV